MAVIVTHNQSLEKFGITAPTRTAEQLTEDFGDGQYLTVEKFTDLITSLVHKSELATVLASLLGTSTEGETGQTEGQTMLLQSRVYQLETRVADLEAALADISSRINTIEQADIDEVTNPE